MARVFCPTSSSISQLRRLPPPSAAGTAGPMGLDPAGHSPGATGHRAVAAPSSDFWRQKVRALGAWRLKRRCVTRSIRMRLASSTRRLATGKGNGAAGKAAPWAAWRHAKTAGRGTGQGQASLPGPKDCQPPLQVALGAAPASGGQSCDNQQRGALAVAGSPS